MARKGLRIGWLVPTVGTFGAVREMVEVSNVLARRGHKVAIYHPDGRECKWLECLAECKKLGFIRTDTLDVLIGIVDWQPDLYDLLLESAAKIKAICLLGFSPSEEMAAALRGERRAGDQAERIIRDAIKRKFLLLADSSWQLEWLRKNVGYDAGPSFGGVNLRMFRPKPKNVSRETVRVVFSGDPRDRKGTDTVLAAIEILKESSEKMEFDSYWNRKFSQEQLVAFLQKADIFLDGHRRAGWCNPVAEAIACGTVPVCTDIGAVRDFALHEQTALVVPVDDAKAMADEALRLAEDTQLRLRLAENGLQRIRAYSYDIVAPHLEAALEMRVYA